MSCIRRCLFLLALLSSFTYLSAQVEICNNGIDDDGDGLVDHFDPDCDGDAGGEFFYFGQPIPGCREKPPVLDSYTLVEKYRTDNTNYPIDQRCGVFVGDMNNDGIPDLVGKAPNMNNFGGANNGQLNIYNGLDGSILQAIIQSQPSHAFSQVALADVDGDNNGDIFIVENDESLRRYEFGSATAVASSASGDVANEQQSPQLADFNGDGNPEVYVGNRIFDAKTCNLILNGGAAYSGRNRQNDAWPFAYDIYKNGDLIPGGGGAKFGNDADGLELICGSKIYLVDIDTDDGDGVSLTDALDGYTPVSIDGVTTTDGFTSIGDVNGDNKIDVVVSGVNQAAASSNDKAIVFIYDPYTATQIGSTFELDNVGSRSLRAGRINLADFDADNDIEIGIAGKNIYMVLEYNQALDIIEEKWSKSPVDDGSQMTGSTVFDFEGDGAAEVVYSEEQFLYVWKGSDGTEMAKISSGSGTRTDYPLVADADGDGQAEIVITAQVEDGPSNSARGWISIYRSKDAPWVAARETWNQHGYIVTNVGPELSIPAHQQEIVNYNFFQEFNEAFNGFLVQTTFLTDWAEPTFAVGDLTTENVIIDLDQCVAQKDVTFTVTLQNNGDWKTPRNTPIAVFDGDPYETTARYLGTFYTTENVEVGATLDVTHTVTDWDNDGWMDLYVLANHYEETLNPGDLLPAKLTKNNSPTLECNYVNNVGFIVKIEDCNVSNAPQIDLDRDNSSGTSGNDYTTAFAIQDDVANIVPVLISEPDVLVADDNDDHMQGANVKISNLLDTGFEFLSHPSLGSSVGSISITAVSSGEISLSGNGTLDEYEDIIKAITYENRKTSGINQTNRVIEVKVNDGTYVSNVAISTIQLKVEPNLDLDSDDSSVAGRDFETTFTEGGAAISVVDTDVIINTDGDINLQSVSVKLTNILNGVNESLSVVGTLPAGISVTTNYENGIGILELSGDASAADYQTAFKQIHYNNTSNNPDVTSRVLELKVNDGYLESLVANTTIAIVAVNDAPEITAPSTNAVYDRQAATPILIAPTVSITDADDTDIHSVIIEITAGWTVFDALTDSYGGALTVVNDGNGKITVTGPASINEFEAYIAGVKFSSTTPLSGVRTASIHVVKDRNTAEGLSSNIYTRIISIDTPGNDAPIAGDDEYEADEDVVLNIAEISGLLRNDSDPDAGDSPTVTLVNGAATDPYVGTYGTLDWNSAGAFTYTQNAGNAELGAGQTLVETVTCTIDDGNLGTDQGTITITINGVNDDPVANDDIHNVDENGSISVNQASGLISNDTDVNTPNDVLLVRSIEGTSTGNNVGTYGTLIWSPLGDFTYTPDNSNPLVRQMVATESIVETFSYTMHDGNGGTSSANLIITIDGQDDAPVISAANVSLQEGVTVVQTVTANDEDDNETKTFSVSGTDADDFDIDPSTGELTFKSPTDFENPTDDGNNNIYNITVTVEDKAGLTDSKDIIISVTNIIDALSLQFGAASYADAENTGGNIPVVVASGEVIPTEVTVNATVTGGTATLTDDYTHTALVTIPAGDYTTPQNIGLSLVVVNEALAENDETIIFELSGQTAGVSLGAQTTTTYTIQNDDVPSITLSLLGSPVVENAGVATITATSDILSANNIVVNLSNTGTASSIDDYTMAGSITIPAGQASATISLTAVQDLLDENNETVITDVASVTNGVESGTQQVTTTILDDDNAPTIAFDASSSNGLESVNSANLPVSLSTSSGLAVSVDYAVSGTASGAGVDYTLASGTLAIGAGTETDNITISGIVDDLLDEDNETVIVTLSNPVNATLGTNTVHTYTITDNDNAPSIAFDASSSNGLESVSSTNLPVILSASSGLAASVDYAVSGTASGAGVDYTLTSGTLTIGAGSTTNNITIASIVDDLLDEDNETVIVTLSNPINATLGTNMVHTYTITDNDNAPSIAFDASSSNGLESVNSANLPVSLSASSGLAVSVDYAVSGTATGSGVDYTLASGTLTIGAGTETDNITISGIVDDLLDEDNETVNVTLSNPVNATLGTNTVHTYTITDNDNAPSIAFDASSSNGLESVSSANLPVSLSASSGLSASVDYTVSGTATGAGVDYTLASGTLMIGAGSTTNNITIASIVNDLLYEDNETVIVTLSNPVNATLGTNMVHTYTITDNDNVPSIAFDASSSNGLESVSSANLPVSLSTSSGLAVSVDYAVSGTASGAGVDYTLASGTLTIGVGTETDNITISGIVDDLLDEDNETVIVTLSNPVNATLGTNTVHTYTITDNDNAPTIAFDASSSNGLESVSSANLPVSLSASSGLAVSVDYAVSGTASGAGVDYTLASGTLTIGAGSTTNNITIASIVDDLLYEDNETVIVTLSNPVNATLGTNTVHTYTITDNESAPQVTLEIDPASITEDESVATIKAVLDTAAAEDVTVTILATDITTSAADYNLSSNTIIIPAGTKEASASLTSALDVVYEGDENVEISITNVTGGSATENGDQAGQITILDDEAQPTVALQLTGSPFSENGGTGTVKAVLSHASVENVQVEVALSGTASATDYNATSLNLTIAALSTDATITLTGVNDIEAEGDETIIAEIINVVNGSENGDQQVTAIITDDDVAGLTVIASDGSNETSEDKTSDSFDVVLNTQPASNVVINITGLDASEGSISTSTLTFTNANWDQEQTVTITGEDDATIDGDIDYVLTLSVDDASSDDAYDGLSTTATVRNLDNDAAGFIVSKSNLTTNESGTTDEFTIVLTAEPDSDVTLKLSEFDDEGTVVGNVVFTPLNWDEPQTITVSPEDDLFVDGDQSYNIIISVVAANSDDNFDLVASQTVSVTNEDNDTAGLSVALSDGSIETSEDGTTDSFDVVLNTQPASNVVINITGLDASEGAISTSSLTFTNANWDQAQTVTITGEDDATIDGDIDYELTLSVDDASSDDAYDGLSTTATVRNLDNDAAGFIVSKSNLTTNESGTTDEFTIVLTAEPDSDVTLKLSEFDDEGTVVGNVVFTPLDWDEPQTITVSPEDDLFVDGDQSYNIIISVVAANSDDNFDLVASQTVSVTNEDNDTAGLSVALSDGSTETSEDGTTDSFDVVLNTQPASNVVINITGLDASEGAISTSSLTFTNANWDQAQTVTITGEDDATIDGDIDYVLTLSVDDASSDDAYDGLSTTATVRNLDNDAAGFIVSKSNLTTNESGTTDEFTIVLTAEPDSDVTLKLSEFDDEGIVVGNVVFTPLNWNEPQTITVTPEDDFFVDGDQSYNIIISVVAANSDDNFDLVASKTVAVTNADNDTAGLNVTLSGGSTETSENGTSDSFDVVLNTQPSSNVVINISGLDATEGSLDVTTLTFTPADWNFAQTVTVSGEDDTEVDGDIAYTLTLSVDDASSDDTYDGLSETVAVTNADNDTAGLSVTLSGGSTETSEKGTTDSFDVVLNTQPSSNVVISISGLDATEGNLDVTTLTFTPADWNVAQTVTINGEDDTEADGDIAYTLTLSVDDASSDDTYDGLSETVAVTNADNDTAGLSVTLSGGSTETSENGTTDSFDVVLNTQPSSNVVINISGLDATEGNLDVTTLTFTPADWNVAQTVTITGEDDTEVDGDIAYTLTLSVDDASSDDTYDGLSETVSVTNADNDTAGLSVTLSGGSTETSENGTTDSFDVVLNTQPSSNVVINISGLDATEGSLDVTTLTFSPADWNVSQTVTITGEDDIEVDGDIAYTLKLAVDDASSDDAYDGMSETVSVTNLDNDSANSTPVAVADEAEVTEGEVLNGTSLLENDSDPENDKLTINTTPVVEPAHGVVVINEDGTYVYTPNHRFFGTDLFTYEVCDDGTPQKCATAVVTITVNENPDRDGDGIDNDREGDDDIDGDGVPNDEDEDSDGDGILDEDEGDVDTDGDETPDYKDKDSDNDGILDEDEGDGDTDGDGKEDYRDDDSDGDGILDEEEGDVDTDGDGQEDYRDLDSDDDGVLDADESTGDCDNDGTPDRIDEDKCYDELEVLEGFSPNGDGVNDNYVIPWINQFNKVSFEVFNRWGNIVYRKDKYENDWNGISNVGFSVGDELPVGTYYYIITVVDTGDKVQGYIYLNR